MEHGSVTQIKGYMTREEKVIHGGDRGYRGRPGANPERLIEVLMRSPYLVADFPEIKEIDVDPLLATPDEVIAPDARIVLDREAIEHPPRPFSHLVIRPYPEGYERTVVLQGRRPGALAADPPRG